MGSGVVGGGQRQLVDPSKELVINLPSACDGPGWWEACVAALACAAELLAGLSHHGWCVLSNVGQRSRQRSGKPLGKRVVVVPALASETFSGSQCFGYFLAQTQVHAASHSWSAIQHQAGHAGGGAANGTPH